MKQATFYRCGVVGLEANKADVNILGNSGLFSEIPIPRSGRGTHIVTRSRRSTERFGLEASARPTTCCHHWDPSPTSRDRDFRKRGCIHTPVYLSCSHAATGDPDFHSRLPSGEESAAGLF